MFVDHLFENHVVSFNRKEAYIVVVEKIAKLEENMLPIKYFIYMIQRMKNLLVYRQLINNGLRCYGRDG